MSWVKLDDRFMTNHKVIDLSKDAKLLHIAALCHCAGELTDGVITIGAAKMLGGLEDVDDLKQTVKELVDVGLWEVAGDAWQIHDYLKYNPSGAKVKAEREENARRQAEWREQHRGNDGHYSEAPIDVSNGVTNGVTSIRPVPVPVPVPVPMPEPVPESASATPPATPAADAVDGETAKKPKKPREPKHPLAQLYHDNMGCYPNATQEKAIIKQVTDVAKFVEAMQAWRMRGFKPTNADGVLDWYRKGIPPAHNGNGNKRAASQPERVRNYGEL